ncbi:DUF3703 domain-containing protein [Aestuariicella hydrocarbonica]|uniref:DUF3703 domain-containing protein n=1 Tax=Pseudomaricurvus hydrocarbonicus TaxID=1470433 RepID=A0A9E5JXA0_9GAMM|nr:DUF3703 domain-containing protein [Aestuariicella hydrocarbonica]NHO66210.1 DUF3703 domain-containing protein [Aestuariicella hydrocarbonica]
MSKIPAKAIKPRFNNRFSRQIAPHVNRELKLAQRAERAGKNRQAFQHLENAHVLGQASTYWHVKAHWQMLQWAARQRQLSEFIGQVIRVFGAATKTVWGLVPQGNTGGANISPFATLPINPRLQQLIHAAKQSSARQSSSARAGH